LLDGLLLLPILVFLLFSFLLLDFLEGARKLKFEIGFQVIVEVFVEDEALLMNLVPVRVTNVENGHMLLRRLFKGIFTDITFIEKLLSEG